MVLATLPAEILGQDFRVDRRLPRPRVILLAGADLGKATGGVKGKSGRVFDGNFKKQATGQVMAQIGCQAIDQASRNAVPAVSPIDRDGQDFGCRVPWASRFSANRANV